MKTVIQLAVASIGIGVLVLGLKAAAYMWTGSVALYSDALESIVNVATAIAALIAVRVSAKPPDSNHPYGHHKAEYLSAVLEGVLIVIAALAILEKAYIGFLAPRPIEAPVAGLLMNGVATALNGVWCAVLFRFGRRNSSPALLADARHLFTDVTTSVGVFLGVALAAATGWLILDPLLAVIVALNILWWGWVLVRQSIGGLMDEAVSNEELEKIRRAIKAASHGAIEAHDLRTRRAARATFIEFHLVVSSDMSVTESHVICDRIETALKADVPDAVVTIHVEPEHKAKHEGKVAVV
jgi:cation diffusion facilitator family transporter